MQNHYIEKSSLIYNLFNYVRNDDLKVEYVDIIQVSLSECNLGTLCLAHTKQKVSNIVGLTALRLAFFMGYE